MRFGVPLLFSTGLALLGLFVASPFASGSENTVIESLGLKRPLCYGGLATPIDIGGDGVTDLLVEEGMLRGEELLPANHLNLVVRGPDGSWVHRQSHRLASTQSYVSTDTPKVLDFDGDGLEDVVVYVHQHFFGEFSAVVFMRQMPSRGLIECGRDTIPSSPSILPLPGGFMTFFDGEEGRGVRWYRWSESAGKPIAAWELAAPPMTLLTVLPAGDGGMIVGRDEDESIWIQDFDSSGITGSRLSNSQQPVDHYGGARVGWGPYEAYWSRAYGSPDTLSVIVPSAAGDDIARQRIAMPEALSRGGDSIVLPSSEGIWICARESGPGDSSTLRIGRVGRNGEITRIDVLPRLEVSPISVVETPGAEAELLVRSWAQDAWSLVSPSAWRPTDPNVGLKIRTLVGIGDLDGDDLPDCVVQFDAGGQSPVGLLRGLGHPPWFSDVIPVINRTGEPYLADMNGDGRQELLLMRGDGPSSIDVLAWNGWRLEMVEAARQYTADPHGMSLHDYDGDGSTDAFDFNQCLRWDRDLRALPPTTLVGDLPGWNPLTVADVDGDGACERITSRATTIYVTRLNLANARYEQIGSWLNSFGPRWAIPANLDADRAQELILVGNGAYAIWDFSAGSSVPVSTVGRALWSGSAKDLDADGHVDIVSDDALAVRWDVTGEARSCMYLLDAQHSDRDARSFDFADVDRDGDLDLVSTGRRGVYVRINDTIRRPGIPGDPLKVRIVSANPGRGTARVAVRLSRPGPVQAGLYDVAGRAVWKLAQTVESSEWVELEVAPERFGRPAAGVYFLRVEGGGREATRRIVVLP